MKLVLQKPIKLGEKGEPITELNFRDEACAGDFRGITLKGFADPLSEDLMAVAGRLCGRNDKEMSKLVGEDFFEVLKIAAGFWPGGRVTETDKSP